VHENGYAVLIVGVGIRIGIENVNPQKADSDTNSDPEKNTKPELAFNPAYFTKVQYTHAHPDCDSEPTKHATPS